MRKNNMKAQIWFTDFVIGTLIFTFMLIAYYTYTTNISNQDSVAITDLIADAKAISSSSTTGGYPDNWNVNNVVRIGFTDDNNRINNDKFSEFTKINYNKSLKLFGTVYDYFTFFFVNESEDVQNVEGFCGVGHPEVNITYDITAAYYYQGPGEDDFLKAFMEDEFTTDVYYHKTNGATVGVNDLTALINNFDSYGFVVMEAPELSGGEYNDFDPVAEPWVESGGFLMLSGELVSGQDRVMTGAEFHKESGLSSSNEPATVVNEDELLDFAEGDGLFFNQAFTIKDAIASPPAIDFKDIARFNCTSSNQCDIGIDDIRNNAIAIARWKYGDGKVFFFSDFDATYLAGDFQENLESSTAKWIGARCFPINMSNIKRDNLVRVDRLLIYNSKIVKMVLYVWQ